jgi:hypothetical protein
MTAKQLHLIHSRTAFDETSTYSVLSQTLLSLRITVKKQIFLLRLSYWSAAIADFGIAILVLMPERMGLTEIVYPMGLISAVAFSWGILLLVADRKPSQRKWVLIPTMVVIALLSTVRIIFSLSEAIEFSFTFLSLGVLLILLLGYSHYIDSKSPASTD